MLRRQVDAYLRSSIIRRATIKILETYPTNNFFRSFYHPKRTFLRGVFMEPTKLTLHRHRFQIGSYYPAFYSRIIDSNYSFKIVEDGIREINSFHNEITRATRNSVCLEC